MNEKTDRPKLESSHAPVEIERKFFVANEEWKRSIVRGVRIRDGLIAACRKVEGPHIWKRRDDRDQGPADGPYACRV